MQISLTLPLTGTASGSQHINLTISGSNHGTLILDVYGTGTAHNCYQKANYRGDPHEWGAKGDGTTPDDTALQRWLGAYGNVFSGAPATAPASFGPWEATIPGNYLTNQPLYCPPNANLRAPANDSREVGDVAPVVQISAGPSFPSDGTTPGQYAVLTAQDLCRISGLSINAQVSGSHNNYVDAVNVVGKGVVIDGHAILLHGYYNLYCSGSNEAGMQLKDAQFDQSWSDGVHIQNCSNVRMIGDIFALAGNDDPGDSSISQAGVYFNGDELTLMSGVVEQAQGPGFMLDGAKQISVSGMYFDTNGRNTAGDSPGILVNSSSSNPSNTISICGNHFHENDKGSGSSTAHVRFAGPASGAGAADNVVLCGNAYVTETGTPPLYVYDVTGTAPTNVSLYENPIPQQNGVFSPGAVSLALLATQARPIVPRNYLNGLTLINDSGGTTVVDIGKGAAADSTNSAIITNLAQCSVTMNSTNTGLGYVDTVGPANANTTYFFYIIADASGTGESCIASASPTAPVTTGLPYKSPIYRMVGALYTTTAGNVVLFNQDGDTFYLNTSVTDIPFATGTCTGTVGTTAKSCALSVPCGHAACTSPGISVEAFGRIASAGTSAVQILASSTDQSDQAPSLFPTAPGNTSTSSATTVAYPFRLYTKNGGQIRVRASQASTTVNETTDGWVFHRQQ